MHLNALFLASAVALFAISLLGVLLVQRRMARALACRIEVVGKSMCEEVDRLVRSENSAARSESALVQSAIREEVGRAIQTGAESVARRIGELREVEETRLAGFLGSIAELRDRLERTQADGMRLIEERVEFLRTQAELRDRTWREASAAEQKSQREELQATLKNAGDSQLRALGELATLQSERLESVERRIRESAASNEGRADALRVAVDTRLLEIRQENTEQLEKIRGTVDERLQGTLEKRLGDSFRQVSERLELVHQGLGEMRSLASGVGDLKRVLTNVKSRGVWGEMQLGAILEDILAPGQFERNVRTKDGSLEAVEYAVRLPGATVGFDEPVWLPIDSKFPMEDYARLCDAQEKGDREAALDAGSRLEARLRASAREIADKYLAPPKTTDFGIMFLPTEGLFAEAVRRADLVELIRRESRVVIAGPTTLAVTLNGLQMGFRTLAIQQRSGEVWKLLGAVKAEFGAFGEILDGVKKKLDQASSNIDLASRRSRAISRKLRGLGELPAAEARALLQAEASELADGATEPALLG